MRITADLTKRFSIDVASPRAGLAVIKNHSLRYMEISSIFGRAGWKADGETRR